MSRWRDYLIILTLMLASVFLIWKGGLDAGKKAAAPAIEAATDKAVVGGLNAQGAVQTSAASDARLRTVLALQERTHELVADLRAHPSEGATVDPAVADDLRAHDRLLCDADPGVCAPAAGGTASIPY